MKISRLARLDSKLARSSAKLDRRDLLLPCVKPEVPLSRLLLSTEALTTFSYIPTAARLAVLSPLELVSLSRSPALSSKTLAEPSPDAISSYVSLKRGLRGAFSNSKTVLSDLKRLPIQARMRL